jgi:methylmalonyl-CoA mutase N-terminal domain/subunit
MDKDFKKSIEDWEKECTRIYGDLAKKEEVTESGIKIKPVYTAQDVGDDVKFEMPGIYPFTRGADPVGFKFSPIRTSYFFGFGTPEDTRKRADMFLKAPGFHELFIACDMPTYNGYDPDDPISRGRVGACGVSLCNTQDLAKLLEGVSLDKVRVAINSPFADLAMLALLIAYAETQGVSQDKMQGASSNRLWKSCFYSFPCYPPKRAVSQMVQLIKYCHKAMPYWDTMNLEGYSVREHRVSAAQELGFLFAMSIGITEAVIEAGLSAEKYLNGQWTKLNSCEDFFEEVAKFRVFRKIWVELNTKRFGCNPDSLRPPRFVVQTGGATLTAQQPLNNIVRVTLQALAGAIGGADSLDPAAYDEALAIPTEEAEQISLRTLQILFHEAKVKRVADPLGGSYYVEYLTRKLEEEVYKIIEEVDRQGGFVRCWENGWFRQECEMASYKTEEEIRKKERILVGVNEYVTEDELKVPVFRYNPKTEEIMIQRLKDFKKNRDNERVKKRLDAVREVAKNEGEQMPLLIEAAREGATLGEMMGVLREVFGWRSS